MCNGNYSCSYAYIHWPINGIGTLSCNNFYACKGVNYPILQQQNEDYTLICDSNNCEYSIINCPSNASCHVICNGEYACRGTTIIWSPDPMNNSTLTCSNLTSCHQTTRPPIYAINDYQDLYVNCNGHSECFQSIIRCPEYAQCHITCNAAYSCHSTRFIWSSYDNYTHSLSCKSFEYSCARILYPTHSSFTESFSLNCLLIKF